MKIGRLSESDAKFLEYLAKSLPPTKEEKERLKLIAARIRASIHIHAYSP